MKVVMAPCPTHAAVLYGWYLLLSNDLLYSLHMKKIRISLRAVLHWRKH